MSKHCHKNGMLGVFQPWRSFCCGFDCWEHGWCICQRQAWLAEWSLLEFGPPLQFPCWKTTQNERTNKLIQGLQQSIAQRRSTVHLTRHGRRSDDKLKIAIRRTFQTEQVSRRMQTSSWTLSKNYRPPLITTKSTIKLTKIYVSSVSCTVSS